MEIQQKELMDCSGTGKFNRLAIQREGNDGEQLDDNSFIQPFDSPCDDVSLDEVGGVYRADQSSIELVNPPKTPVQNITNRKLGASKEPEPLPIFSCIYCAAEHLVLTKLSTRMLTQKYTSIAPTLGNLRAQESAPRRRRKSQTASKAPQVFRERSVTMGKPKLVHSFYINECVECKPSEVKLKELLLSKSGNLLVPRVFDKKLQWMTNKIYILRKTRISKAGTCFDKSASSNPNHKSFLPKSFTSAKKDSFSIMDARDDSWDGTEHDVYDPAFEIPDASFIAEALRATQRLKISETIPQQSKPNVSRFLTRIIKTKVRNGLNLTERSDNTSTLAALPFVMIRDTSGYGRKGNGRLSERRVNTVGAAQTTKNAKKFAPYIPKAVGRKEPVKLPKFKAKGSRNGAKNASPHSKSRSKGPITARIKLKKPPQKILVHYNTILPRQKLIKSCGTSIASSRTSSSILLFKPLSQAGAKPSLRLLEKPPALSVLHKSSGVALAKRPPASTRSTQMMAHEYIQSKEVRGMEWDSNVF
eukprot:TRINITY_DN2793_c0_g8_i1.p1 TRINITY_DN2793_c0_g8~~TRINITY_DN2793_c0_g8_i1.p1  ORF type:complete len:531 (-),score=108.45 TRINITY_DN2793_c0_g8_i1:184-1776(-)